MPPHDINSCRLFPCPKSWHCRGTFFVQYEVREELGEGAFGKAIKVRRRRDGRMFVAKVMHEQGLSDKAREEVPPLFLPC